MGTIRRLGKISGSRAATSSAQQRRGGNCLKGCAFVDYGRRRWVEESVVSRMPSSVTSTRRRTTAFWLTCLPLPARGSNSSRTHRERCSSGRMPLRVPPRVNEVSAWYAFDRHTVRGVVKVLNRPGIAENLSLLSLLRARLELATNGLTALAGHALCYVAKAPVTPDRKWHSYLLYTQRDTAGIRDLVRAQHQDV